MFQEITYKMHSNVSIIYFVNMAQIKCVEASRVDIEVQNCFDVNLRFGGEYSVNCRGVIAGGYEAINRFINGDDATLFIDSTKL